MSEIENKSSHNRTSKRRLIKRSTRVDLTPMVDLGFLLITFFVFTTQLTQPTVMNLNMPFDKDKERDDVCESCVLTVMLKEDNIIQYYEGKPAINSFVGTTDFSSSGIRNIILQKKAGVKKVTSGAKELVLIIKASNESTFQNFVDIVDEVTINNVKHYYVSEVDAIDKILFHLEY
jgi:biopolymer transport protein ExbD